MRNLLLLAALVAPAFAQDDLDPAGTPVKAVVREAAIFKDGHAFVLAEAMIPPRTGWVVTTDVPEAILGSLWVYSGSPKVKVEAVRAGFEIAERQEPCLTLLDTLEAAQGQDVVLTLHETGTQTRTLEGMIADAPKIAPERPSAEAPAEFIRGETLHVRTPSGLEVVRKAAVLSLRCKKEVPLRRTVREVRRRILVRVAAEADAGEAPAPLRFVYIQKGLRWIPEYRAEVLAGNRIKLALQATVVNELSDLRDVNAALVVGIPNFLMKDTLSPMALREAAAGLSSYFPSSARFANMTSNALMSQVARYTEARPAGERVPDASLEVLAKGTSADEYFLYSKPHVSLRRGERATYPIFEGTFAYEDVYTLRIGPVPPRFIAADRSEELRQALFSPKVVHGLKIQNNGTVPWTTGPSLIVRDGRALSQDLLRFTPAGGSAILPVAEMADVAVRIHDVEQNRVLNVKIDGTPYSQVFMKGTVCLVSHRKDPIPVEIERIFFGQADKVHDGGTSEAFDFAAQSSDRYSTAGWPHWWHSVNGMFQASWKVRLQAGKPSEVSCEWSYFRR